MGKEIKRICESIMYALSDQKVLVHSSLLLYSNEMIIQIKEHIASIP